MKDYDEAEKFYRDSQRGDEIVAVAFLEQLAGCVRGGGGSAIPILNEATYCGFTSGVGRSAAGKSRNGQET